MIGGAPARFLGVLLAGAVLIAVTVGGLWLLAEFLRLLWSWYIGIGVWAGWVTT